MPRKTRGEETLPLDLELERTLRNQRKASKAKKKLIMENIDKQDGRIVTEENLPYHPHQQGDQFINADILLQEAAIPIYNAPPGGHQQQPAQFIRPPPNQNIIPPNHQYIPPNFHNIPPQPPIRQPMRTFTNPNGAAVMTGLQPPTTEANNFDIKTSVIVMVQQNQYSGAATEDPHTHLRNFERVCHTFKIGGLSDDCVKLRLFVFSLTGRAQVWSEGLPPGQCKTWASLKDAFLQKFFPPGRTAQLTNEIMRFQQHDQETIYEAWERYKDLLKKCPHHGLQGWYLIHSFHGGLHPQHQNEIVAASGGSLMNKTYEEAIELIENLAEHSYSTPRANTRRVANIQGVDDLKEIKAQLAALTSHMKGNTNQPQPRNDGGRMDTFGAIPEIEQVNYLQNRNHQQRNDPFSNTYNEGWRKHPNFSWSQGQPKETMGQQQQQQQYQQYGNNSNFSNNSNSSNVYRPPGHQQKKYEDGPLGEKKTNLEDMMMKFMSKIDNTVENLASTVQTVKAATDQNTASIKMLERQMGQVSDALQTRAQGQFPSQPEKKQTEECNAIYLRSGKELNKDLIKEPTMEPEKITVKSMRKPDMEEKVEEKGKSKKPEEKGNSSVPYPSRLKSKVDDAKYAKFLNVFKKLHINIPFADALAEMPSYAKFLKDILSKKRKIPEDTTVPLTEECSAILQHKLPPKLKDPGSFTIPIQIGNHEFGKSLCDLGASINMMPLSIFRKLGLGEVQPTNMILQLADRSINYPYGVIEDILVKVGQFYFPTDFVILDIDEDKEIPLILGRPFLATGRALIDVEEGELTLRVGDKKEVFDVFHTQKRNTENTKGITVDILEPDLQQEQNRKRNENTLMKAIDYGDSEEMMAEHRSRPIHNSKE